MEDLLNQAFRKIENLEKKLERYFSLLRVENELDFILNGTYIVQDDYDKVMAGQY